MIQICLAGCAAKLQENSRVVGGIAARSVEHGLPGARIPADADGEMGGHGHANLNRAGIQRHAGHIRGSSWTWNSLAQDDAAQLAFDRQVQPDPHRLDVRLGQRLARPAGGRVAVDQVDTLQRQVIVRYRARHARRGAAQAVECDLSAGFYGEFGEWSEISGLKRSRVNQVGRAGQDMGVAIGSNRHATALSPSGGFLKMGKAVGLALPGCVLGLHHVPQSIC